ncbi:hypothetical protein [Streptomyces sp. 8N706]|uniref:hypothetical protein n=1 Tax=Streptomyces sp. 8N706 TaxID=3457416 RepID=UPI003FD2BB3E
MSEKRERDGRGLDRQAAERMLRGERLRTAEGGDRPDAGEDTALAALDRLLAAAAAGPAGAEPERARQRRKAALSAFRAARQAGGPTVPLPQDDWRPRRRRGTAARTSRSVHAVIVGVVAAVALGGVAVAAGNGSVPDLFGTGDSGSRPAPSRSARPGPFAGTEPPGRTAPGTDPTPAPGRPGGGEPSAGSPGSGASTGRAAEGLCRAYQLADGSGRALDSEAFARLLDAAGSEETVNDYCDQLIRGQKKSKKGEGDPGGKPGRRSTAEAPGPGTDDDPARPREGASSAP